MINLSKYHSYILTELNTRGLLGFIFEAEEDKKEDSEEKTDDEEPEADKNLEDNSEEKKSESNEDESNEDDKKLIQQPNSLDAEINKMLNKAEELAIDSAAKQKTFESIKRCKSFKKISILYESNDKVPLIDVEYFANQIARYINNYDSFIDMPQLIIKQAVNFLKKNYDEETAEQFEESLRDMYNLEIVKSPSPPGSKLGVPNAVGAKQASA
jgi:hypothetical protein